MELWKKDINLSKILCIEEDIKIISCDIFDTLLMRTVCKPEDLFTKVGEEGIKLGKIDKNIKPSEFKELRIFAEKRAREKKYHCTKSSEINLYEIYSELSNVIDKDNVIEIEMEVEKRYTYINPVILSLLKNFHDEGKKVILLSDMYLTKNQIVNLLTYNGMDMGIIDELIVSCEYGASKSVGDLYDIELHKFPNVKPSNILHIGDTYISDVKRAQEKGINAVYYDVKSCEASSFEYEKYFSQNMIPELSSLRKVVVNLSNNYEYDDRFWFEFGASIMGPVLVPFVEWSVDIAVEENLDYIAPLMREGVILSKLLSKSLERRNNHNINISPLFVSRKATYLPSIICINENEIKDYIDSSNVKLKDFLLNLGLKCKEEFDIDISLYELKNKGEIYDKLINYILQEDNISLLKSKIHNEKIKFNKYIKQNFKNNCKILTMDIGYKGTIQNAIENIVGCGTGYKFEHLVLMSNEDIIDKVLNGVNIKGFISNLGNNIEFMKKQSWTPGIFEVLMMDERGSTVGYHENGSTIDPILEKTDDDKNDEKYKKLCHEGILEFQKYFFYLDDKKKIISRIIENREHLHKIWTRVMELPTLKEAKNLGKLHHEDKFNGYGYSTFCKKEMIKTVNEIGIDKFKKMYSSNSTLWINGIITNAQPLYIVNKYLEDKDEYKAFSKMLELGLQVKKDKINKVIVYGAGEMGRTLIKALKLLNIRAESIVDKNDALWNSYIFETPITSLDKVMCDNKSCNIFVIGSLSFAYEIQNELNEKAEILKKHIKIYNYFEVIK